MPGPTTTLRIPPQGCEGVMVDGTRYPVVDGLVTVPTVVASDLKARHGFTDVAPVNDAPNTNTPTSVEQPPPNRGTWPQGAKP